LRLPKAAYAAVPEHHCAGDVRGQPVGAGARSGAAGPIANGFGILNAGKILALLTSAVIIVMRGFICARLLRQTRPADADARPDVQP
jgi:hypothetical protein